MLETSGLNINIVFLVQGVDPGGPAHRVNMIQGDLLLQIEDQPIRQAQSIEAVLYTYEERTSISVRVLRQGQPIDLDGIKISPRKSS